jgi:type IV pilus assembly protein PilC
MYEYKGRDKDGDIVEGLVEADDEDMAVSLLEDESIFVVTIKARSGNLFSNLGGDLFNRISSKDLVVFSRQLSVMVSATLPIVKSLRILVKQTENVNLKAIISEIADDVEAGAKLSVAMAKHPVLN